jgi:hypothetical protein
LSEAPLVDLVNQEEETEAHQPFSSFEDLVAWVGHQREGILHAHLLYDVHLVAFSPFQLTLRLSQKAPRELPRQLEALLKKQRGEAWTIAISDEIGHLTLHEKSQKASEERQAEILKAPLVKILMDAFPGTELIHVEDR